MKINLFRILVFGIAVFILFIFFISLSKNNIYDTSNLIGKNIDSFEIISLNTKKKINDELLKKNEFTLINFWSSWCAPCRSEHKYLMRLKNNNKNLKILGINFKDKKNQAINFLLELGNPYYFTGQDTDGRISINFGVYGIPESILINKELIVIKKFVGPLNNQDYQSILNLID
jgi:cytochrome c biogenesis protein CcmG/thiol:disulfide interchange protein DsbE